MKLPRVDFDRLSLLTESSQPLTIGVFPGAFKPPHRGHFKTAAAACSECDQVHIIMSPKERLLNQASKDLGVPEKVKYKGLMPGGNTYEQVKSKVDIQVAEVDRQTSASEMRMQICDASYGLQDMNTFEQCMSKYLPDSLTPERKKHVIQLLHKAPGDDVISPQEANNIWKIYIDQLRDLYPSSDIYFKMADISPIADTYNFAGELFNNTQERVTLKLYTGL